MIGGGQASSRRLLLSVSGGRKSAGLQLSRVVAFQVAAWCRAETGPQMIDFGPWLVWRAAGWRQVCVAHWSNKGQWQELAKWSNGGAL